MPACIIVFTCMYTYMGSVDVRVVVFTLGVVVVVVVVWGVGEGSVLCV